MNLTEIVDQITEDEATEILRWLACERPSWLRVALRQGPDRVKRVYHEAGRPHS